MCKLDSMCKHYMGCTKIHKISFSLRDLNTRSDPAEGKNIDELQGIFQKPSNQPKS